MPDEAATLLSAMPFAEALGIQLDEASPDRVRAHVAWAPERCTAGGVLHGGVLMALADSCGGLCAYLQVAEAGASTATVESKTNFLRAVREGEVTAEARPLHAGSRNIVVETELRDDRGRLVAKTTQTQAVLTGGG